MMSGFKVFSIVNSNDHNSEISYIGDLSHLLSEIE